MMSIKIDGCARWWLLAIGWLWGFAGPVIGAEASSGPAPSKSKERVYFERTIGKIEPELIGASDRLPLYLQLFERELIHDTRLFPCQIAVEDKPGQVVLKGCVEFEENRAALEKLFTHLGFGSIDNQVVVLPSRDLGKKRFGLIGETHSFSFDQPAGRQELLTDCLLGTPLFLLAEGRDGYLLCHGSEGYVGYVKAADIERVDSEEFTRYQSGAQAYLSRDQQIGDRFVLPVGARLKVVEQGAEEVTVVLPGGTPVTLPAESCRVRDGGPDARIERIIAAAEELLGTPYVWGGNTSEGIDCSGLVQTAFATAGINLARDSNQQILAGRLVATRWYREGLRRGDTLYFLGEYGKVRHTGIYLGEGRYIEAVRPAVRYSSFDPESSEYSKRGDATFCFGKRIVE